MNRQKIKQGDFGYISHKKKTEILKTIVFFAIPLSLYIAKNTIVLRISVFFLCLK